EAVDRALLPQVLQDTAWQLVFRQGSPQDAERMQALFGKAWMTDESWSNDGRVYKRRVERPRVSINEWMNALEPGDAWLRVAPIDKGWRQERVRVALPNVGKTRSQSSVNGSVNASVTMPGTPRRALTESAPRPDSGASVVPGIPREPSALPPVPPDCPAELV